MPWTMVTQAPNATVKRAPVGCSTTIFSDIYDNVNVTRCLAATGFNFMNPPVASRRPPVDELCDVEACRYVYITLRDFRMEVECQIRPAIYLFRDVLVPLSTSSICLGNESYEPYYPLTIPDASAYQLIEESTELPLTPSPVVLAVTDSSKATETIVGVLATVAFVVTCAVGYWWRRHARRLDKTLAITGDEYQDLDMSHEKAVHLAAAAPSASPQASSLWHDSELLAFHVSSGDVEDLRVIGAGGHGVVYLVRFRQTQLLASKRLTQEKLSRAKTRAFIDEIKLVAKLDHPCIVTFIGAAWTKETDLQALFEYMPNGDLCTHLTNTQQHDETETWDATKLQIAIDIADALVYVHSFSPPLVHRDLKSRNILLSEDMRAKLTDFGVSRYQSDAHTMTTGVGTSRWLAPAVINGGGGYDERCDVYSFGMVLNELDSHRLPFAGLLTASGMPMPEMAILQRVSEGKLRPTFRASCPSSLCALALECLSFDPEERPPAVQIAFRLRNIAKDVR